MAWKRVAIDGLVDKVIEVGAEMWGRYRRKNPEPAPHSLLKVPESPQSIAFQNLHSYFPTTSLHQHLSALHIPRVLLLVTACAATANVSTFYRSMQAWAHVKVVATEDAVPFLDIDITHHALTARDELQRWADILIISPLSNATLLRIAGGQDDDLVTAIVRDWEPTKPFYIAPSMTMPEWQSPLTTISLRQLEQRNNAVIF